MNYRHLLITLGALGLLAFGGPGVQAATFTVSNLSDAGAGSLRQAILDANAAPGADTIVCQAGLTGIIRLLGSSGQLEITGDLEIRGPGAAALAVHGSSSVTEDSGVRTRIFHVDDEATVTISGLTMAGGSAGQATEIDERGGGIYNSGDLTLNDCIVSGNRATLGGGIYNDGGLRLSRCTLSGNSAQTGGGIWNDGRNLTLSGCTLSGNSAPGSGFGPYGGGGILSVGGTVTLTACTVFANFGGPSGGGIVNLGASHPMTVQNCTIAGNGTSGLGGGIYNEGVITVERSVINGNVAGSGGGVANDGGAALFSSTLSGNRASHQGGGLFNRSDATIAHCTFFGNRAEEGGGVHHTSFLNVAHTLVANSGAGRNYVFGEHSTLTNGGYNLDSDGSGGFDQPGDQSGTLEAPLDPRVGPLQNNGGPTATHALLPGSPALDRGGPALSPGGTEPVDQRGFPRFVDGDGDGAAVMDIGAYELGFYGLGDFGGPPRQGFLTFSTVEAQNTALPAGTTGFNLTIHYSADLAPQTLVATLNGQDVTPLFNPGTPEGFETVRIPLREGPNRLVLRVKGVRDGKPAQEVGTLGFWVGKPPYGPR